MGTYNSRNASSPADALVIFGVTGDLARKMIFPALYAMVKRGDLNRSLTLARHIPPFYKRFHR